MVVISTLLLVSLRNSVPNSFDQLSCIHSWFSFWN